ncbi:hypothetical protein EDC01DRAFT_101658 [Geopyxis carbonaria]|nr:hypothetical protein EDC01DRAFT_101658 [Geopyxis carbonaria]
MDASCGGTHCFCHSFGILWQQPTSTSTSTSPHYVHTSQVVFPSIKNPRPNPRTTPAGVNRGYPSTPRELQIQHLTTPLLHTPHIISPPSPSALSPHTPPNLIMICAIDIPADSDFTLANIPFGIFSTPSNPRPRVGTIVGDTIIDLSTLSLSFPLHPSAPPSIFASPTLAPFAALPKPIRTAVRSALQHILHTTPAASPTASLLPHLHSAAAATLHLPFAIGDYTDFYAGLHHARTVGTLFRGAAAALQPNYLHLPVGYHGRASSVVPSGTQVVRPRGQLPPAPPTWAPTQKLDFELELGCFIAGGNVLGTPVPAGKAADLVFGYVLVNDWSARDVQAWEYVPLGPFTAKSFATTISPWVVMPEALAAARVPAMARPAESAELLPYLREGGEGGAGGVLDVNLTVDINGVPVTKTRGRHVLWSFEQMVAQQTVGGCNLRTGDLLASGTISGEGAGEAGCLLEATRNGERAVKLGGGEERMWIEDGDEVEIRGWWGEGDGRVGFGECRGVVVPCRRWRWSRGGRGL